MIKDKEVTGTEEQWRIFDAQAKKEKLCRSSYPTATGVVPYDRGVFNTQFEPIVIFASG